MSKAYQTVSSKFFCTRCGKEGLPVRRKMGQERAAGHLKKIYCLYCKDEVNHVEIKDKGKYTYDDFLEEFNSGRFVEGDRTAIKELFGCSKTDCPYNKNGKCWNSNNSADCRHKPKEV